MSAAAPPPPDGEALLAAHYLPVMRLCLSRLRDPSDAEDAAQETFRRAVQNAAGLRDDPLPWLLTVARNVCTDELRRRQRMAGMVLPDDATPAADPTPEGVVVGRLSAVELLGRLTPGERRAVAARMGSVAGTPATSTTRVLLARARDKVRRYLEDTQSAFGTATVSATEALHELRTRFAGRTLIGSGRAAMLIPAALIIGVVGSPTSVPGTLLPAPPVSSAPSAVVPAPDDALQARLGSDAARGGTVLGNVGSVLHGTQGPGGITLPPPVGPTWMDSLPQDDYHQVATLDIEPSPNYATDHTVLMIGPNHTCGLQLCSVVYRSGDGGATWSLVTGKEAMGLHLALPPATFAAGTYWVTGKSGADKTEDGGGHFTQVLPAASGYPMLPARPGPLALLFSSGNALWGIRGDDSSVLLSLYADGDIAQSAPYLLDTPSGDVVLQAVVPAVTSGVPQPLLERCSPSCGPPLTLPMQGNATEIVPSPHIAVDHTLYIPGVNVLAVSHDDGQTFSVEPAPGISEATVTAGPSGRRIVAVLSGALAYSDDDGMSWHHAAIPRSTLDNPHTVTELRPGRLIASMERGDDPGWYWFVCSTDGSAWSLCGPDRG